MSRRVWNNRPFFYNSNLKNDVSRTHVLTLFIAALDLIYHLENFEQTLDLFEKMLPGYFAGAKDVYNTPGLFYLNIK